MHGYFSPSLGLLSSSPSKEALDVVSDLAHLLGALLDGLARVVEQVPELLLGRNHQDIPEVHELAWIVIEERVVLDLLVAILQVLGKDQALVHLLRLLCDLILLLVDLHSNALHDLVFSKLVSSQSLGDPVVRGALQGLHRLRTAHNVEGLPLLDLRGAAVDDEVLILHVVQRWQLSFPRPHQLDIGPSPVPIARPDSHGDAALHLWRLTQCWCVATDECTAHEAETGGTNERRQGSQRTSRLRLSGRPRRSHDFDSEGGRTQRAPGRAA
mmetsp:Transcript_31254/g.58699  ORF Transcript_31254/g.58699 Transcript_31254/m.58699 type:complete len:270 (+) Transcript_31254:82-891(+)